LFHRDKKFNVWIITSELIDRQRGWGTGGERGCSPRASFHWVTDLLSPPVSAERGVKEKKERKIEEKKGRILRFNDRSIVFWRWRCLECLRAIIEQIIEFRGRFIGQEQTQVNLFRNKRRRYFLFQGYIGSTRNVLYL